MRKKDLESGPSLRAELKLALLHTLHFSQPQAGTSLVFLDLALCMLKQSEGSSHL